MPGNAFKYDSSVVDGYGALISAGEGVPTAGDFQGYRAVVIGGGTGAPVSIRALLSLGIETSVVVAMADDGGSTGELRRESNVTPPGDVRKCLTAMARDPASPLARAFRYRFPVANNHSLGNLMIAALEDACGSFPEAIEICERLLDAQGHVYPSTLNKITMSALTWDGQVLDGQAISSKSRTTLRRVSIQSKDGEIKAYAPAIEAIRAADLIVLGPGSLFTSIIASLLVPGVREAISESEAMVLFVCSLADMQGETWGLSAREHVFALLDHGMRGLVDYVLIHSRGPIRYGDPVDAAETGDTSFAVDTNSVSQNGGIRPVQISASDVERIQEEGVVVIARNLVDPAHPTWHSPQALKQSLLQVIKLTQERRVHAGDGDKIRAARAAAAGDGK